MTKLLVIDTETTGVDPYKARLVELAAILWDCDTGLLDRYSTLVRPEGFEIPAQAEAIHGICTEQAWDEGVPLLEALTKLGQLVADCRKPPVPRVYIPGVAYRLIAHNIRYDVTVLSNEYQRVSFKTYPLNYLPPFCTMDALTERCRLPSKYGRYKWPRLQEAWEFCFDSDISMLGDAEGVQQHRAAFDAEACRRIYQHGLDQGWWSHD